MAEGAGLEPATTRQLAPELGLAPRLHVLIGRRSTLTLFWN